MTTAEKKRLLRPRAGRMVGGVCAAFARHFGIDVTLLRVIWGVLTVLGVGSPILIYVVCWIVIPEEEAV